MADDEVRAAERAWRASGARADEARWLAARLRKGELAAARLRAAAWAGNGAAGDVVGVQAHEGDDPRVDFPALELLAGRGPVALGVASAIASVWAGLPRSPDAPERLLALDALRAWAQAPSLPREREARDAALALARDARARRLGDPWRLAVAATATLTRWALEPAPAPPAAQAPQAYEGEDPLDAEALDFVDLDETHPARQLELLGVEDDVVLAETRRALRDLDPGAPEPPPLPTGAALERAIREALPVGRRVWLERFLGTGAPATLTGWGLVVEEWRWVTRHRLLRASLAEARHAGLHGHELLVAVRGDVVRLLTPERPEDVAALLVAEPGLERAPADDLARLLAVTLLEAPLAHELVVADARSVAGPDEVVVEFTSTPDARRADPPVRAGPRPRRARIDRRTGRVTWDTSR
jgi:hypothetical protein